MKEDVNKWIEEWCWLYPEDAEFNGNKLRAKGKDVVNKMQKFCKEHPNYTKHIIFAATNLYIKEQRERDWQYTKMATYFISKLGQPSILEAYCEKYIAWSKNPIEDIPQFYPIDEFI
jgi:hypothetical protein